MKKSKSFKKAVEKLKKDKTIIYKRMELEAKDPDTILYYSNRSNNFSDVDITIASEAADI